MSDEVDNYGWRNALLTVTLLFALPALTVAIALPLALSVA